MQVNLLKSFWAKPEINYLGFNLSRRGIKPDPNKIKQILAIDPPSNKNQLRRFIGILNYYKDVCRHRAYILHPLTSMTSNKLPFTWKKEHQDTFIIIKREMAKIIMLIFSYYTKQFDLHTDSSNYQLGATISQEGNIIAYFPQKTYAHSTTSHNNRQRITRNHRSSQILLYHASRTKI